MSEQTGSADDGGYRRSHLGAAKAVDYDRDFHDPKTAKGLDWQLERALLDRVFSHDLPRAPRRVLDFACGTGRVLADLESRAPETIGVDISADMLAVAASQAPRSQLITGDATAGEVVLDEPVDVVTSFRFLLNAEPELRLAALRWIRTILAPGGRIVVNFHLNPNSARGRYLLARWRGERREAMLTPAAAESMLGSAGFTVVARYGYEFLPYRRAGEKLTLPGARARVEQALLGRPGLTPNAGAFLLVARDEDG